MRIKFLLVLTVAAVSAQPALAARPAYLDPYENEAHHELRFANLEFAIPPDPLLWSSDPGWEPHNTPPRLLVEATEKLRAAVPAGTSSGDAAETLLKAGAKCREKRQGGANGNMLTCTYRDVEYPEGGDYTDDISWRVTLPLLGGRVADLAVARIWSRH
ncbi:MAG: hypothetical protein KGM18_00140 [Sphingomonadales bacterium]|nr:hypothetical protein [Sphingomonadales bacterium]